MKVKREQALLFTGLIAMAIAVLGFDTYMGGSITGNVVATGAMGGMSSLVIAAVTLIIALTLFAKYFKLIK